MAGQPEIYWFVPADSPIKTLADMNGKTIGYSAAGSSSHAATIPEFIAYAKANPSKINMASAGIGNTTHVAGELFMMLTGTKFTHVPYRGAAPAVADLIGGQVQVYFDGISGSLEHVRSGKLRALGVTTAQRADVLPNVPSIAELVPGYEAGGWYGI